MQAAWRFLTFTRLTERRTGFSLVSRNRHAMPKRGQHEILPLRDYSARYFLAHATMTSPMPQPKSGTVPLLPIRRACAPSSPGFHSASDVSYHISVCTMRESWPPLRPNISRYSQCLCNWKVRQQVLVKSFSFFISRKLKRHRNGLQSAMCRLFTMRSTGTSKKENSHSLYLWQTRGRNFVIRFQDFDFNSF